MNTDPNIFLLLAAYTELNDRQKDYASGMLADAGYEVLITNVLTGKESTKILVRNLLDVLSENIEVVKALKTLTTSGHTFKTSLTKLEKELSEGGFAKAMETEQRDIGHIALNHFGMIYNSIVTGEVKACRKKHRPG